MGRGKVCPPLPPRIASANRSPHHCQPNKQPHGTAARSHRETQLANLLRLRVLTRSKLSFVKGAYPTYNARMRGESNR